MYKKYKLIYDHFKHMEKRYHTWMNYYSLFNGALLVAYCTILVSTGKVIELEGGYDGSVAQTIQGGAKVFYLNCTYWDILALIALLGVVASYAWYLSIIGHGKWIDSWRRLLQNEDKCKDIGIEKKLGGITFETIPSFFGKKMIPHFHSTFKITKSFILGVLFAWILMLGYSIGSHTMTCCLVLFSIVLEILFIIIEYFLHCLTGSDLTGFTNENGNLLREENAKGGDKTEIAWKCPIKVIICLLLLVLLVYFAYNELCINRTSSTIHLQINKSELPQSVKRGEMGSDSLQVTFKTK